MDLPDSVICQNRDWDHSYLCQIFDQDFHDFTKLWKLNNMDSELVSESDKLEKYCPIMEDISLDDEVLCSAVESIEQE